MSRGRGIGGIVLAVLLTVFGQARADEAASIPDVELKAIQSLVEKLVRLGLPDTAGGEYFVGPAFVQQRFDPDKEEPVVPTHY